MKLSDLHDVEERVTDAASGGQKGQKLTQLAALDPVALMILGRVAGMGANKYAAHNYLRGYDWNLSFDQLMRHAMLFWAGEDIDPESGLPHMAHAAWAALALVSFLARGVGNDNRPPRLTAEAVALPRAYEWADPLLKRGPVLQRTSVPEAFRCSECGRSSTQLHDPHCSHEQGEVIP